MEELKPAKAEVEHVWNPQFRTACENSPEDAKSRTLEQHPIQETEYKSKRSGSCGSASPRTSRREQTDT